MQALHLTQGPYRLPARRHELGGKTRDVHAAIDRSAGGRPDWYRTRRRTCRTHRALFSRCPLGAIFSRRTKKCSGRATRAQKRVHPVATFINKPDGKKDKSGAWKHARCTDGPAPRAARPFLFDRGDPPAAAGGTIAGRPRPCLPTALGLAGAWSAVLFVSLSLSFPPL